MNVNSKAKIPNRGGLRPAGRPVLESVVITDESPAPTRANQFLPVNRDLVTAMRSRGQFTTRPSEIYEPILASCTYA